MGRVNVYLWKFRFFHSTASEHYILTNGWWSPPFFSPPLLFHPLPQPVGRNDMIVSPSESRMEKAEWISIWKASRNEASEIKKNTNVAYCLSHTLQIASNAPPRPPPWRAFLPRPVISVLGKRKPGKPRRGRWTVADSRDGDRERVQTSHRPAKHRAPSRCDIEDTPSRRAWKHWDREGISPQAWEVLVWLQRCFRGVNHWLTPLSRHSAVFIGTRTPLTSARTL